MTTITLAFIVKIIYICVLLCTKPCFTDEDEGGDTQNGSSCTGPSGKPGFCIALSKCPKLAKILEEDPIRPERLRFLQYSTCLYDNTDPHVCCPSEEASTTARPQTVSPTVTPLSIAKQLEMAIKNHPNAVMLPKPSNCGQGMNILNRIIGGETPGLGEYPWLVLLSFLDPTGNYQLACGGTLISPRYVLTAGHCTQRLPPGIFLRKVRIGEFNKTKDPDCEGELCAPPFQEIDVEEVINHANYSMVGVVLNDIALVRLARAPILGPYVQPICLPQGSVLEGAWDKEGSATVSGWGRTKFDVEDGSDALQRVRVPIVPAERCRLLLSKFKNGSYPQSLMCAGGEKGKDSCKGDSGGPLMKSIAESETSEAYTYQIGIVSVGVELCGMGVPAVYTRMSSFMLWILDNLRP